MSMKALERHLEPFTNFLNDPDVTEICINKPFVLLFEKHRKFDACFMHGMDFSFLSSLAALVAEFNNKDFPSILISGTLPGGQRIQIVMPPAAEKGTVVISIRCHQSRDMTLDDYLNDGAFSTTSLSGKNKDELRLHKLYKNNDYHSFINHAILARKNILISGGTGTGKTTFLNACLRPILEEERLITVEDTREVRVLHRNAVHLLFNEENLEINALNIFKACLRLRPDRIFLSELRGHEVWPFLRAANSGHPGSISTVHADSPEGAFSQLVFMMQQAGSTSSEAQLRSYIKSIIHVVIQLERATDSGRFMQVSEVWYGGPNYV